MKSDLIESWSFDPGRTPDMKFRIGILAEAQRQFTVSYNSDGGCIVCSPKIGNRTPANPQPTPPVTQVLRRAA